jgi:hypothetical protein
MIQSDLDLKNQFIEARKKPTSKRRSVEDLESNGNIGLDTRPSMQLTLRLRGPKNSNL